MTRLQLNSWTAGLLNTARKCCSLRLWDVEYECASYTPPGAGSLVRGKQTDTQWHRGTACPYYCSFSSWPVSQWHTVDQWCLVSETLWLTQEAFSVPVYYTVHCESKHMLPYNTFVHNFNVDQFLKFFHRHILQKICNKVMSCFPKYLVTAIPCET